MRFRRSYPSSHCTTGIRHGSLVAMVAALSALNAASQVPAVSGQEGAIGALPSLEPPRQMAERTDAADKSILSRSPAAKLAPVVNRYKANSPGNAVGTTAPSDNPSISDPAFAG